MVSLGRVLGLIKRVLMSGPWPFAMLCPILWEALLYTWLQLNIKDLDADDSNGDNDYYNADDGYYEFD